MPYAAAFGTGDGRTVRVRGDTDPKQPLGLGREAPGFAESLSHRGREPVTGSWGRGVGAATRGRAGAESPVVERFHRRGFDKPC